MNRTKREMAEILSLIDMDEATKNYDYNDMRAHLANAATLQLIDYLRIDLNGLDFDIFRNDPENVARNAAVRLIWIGEVSKELFRRREKWKNDPKGKSPLLP